MVLTEGEQAIVTELKRIKKLLKGTYGDKVVADAAAGDGE